MEFQWFPIPLLDYVGLPLLFLTAVLLAALKAWRPLRRRVQNRLSRLKANVPMAGIAFVVIRLALVPVVVAVALWAHRRGIGLVKLLPMADWIAAAIAFLLLDYTLEAATEFHHSNLRLPIRVERALNWLVVTPRMHGIHHSIIRRETDSNFSNIFSFWDRLHRTALLHVPQDQITIGVPAYRDAGELTFVGLLLMPFRRQRPTGAAAKTATREGGELAE